MRKQKAMIITVIPVKPFSEAKTRLADVLNATQRAELSRQLFLRTLKIATGLSTVIVVSRSKVVRQLAQQELSLIHI